MLFRRLLASIAALSVTAPCALAAAQTGICDSNPPASTQACIDAIQAGGTVHNDIFHDANGLTADQLPLFGKVFNAWPGCDTTSFAGCSGQSLAPFDCPGEYQCTGLANNVANASLHANALDRLWWHPCRTTNHTLDANGCPVFGQCLADGVPDNYYPWEGIVFDLGGPSNKVAIFAENDHGPQPCESTEYTVFLSDNPLSKDIVLDPKSTGVNPQSWNRAVLSEIYTKGFVEVRPPDPATYGACGDTALYSVEEDSFVSVYSLPCGITFRYAAIVAGNDGLDFPECQFHSSEAELDAIAGLTESGSAVCPDADGDLYVDCTCPGAPPVCDCADGDPAIHPGAPEACDSPDLNCDGQPSPCGAGLTCYQSLCLTSCDNEQNFCPEGQECTATPSGKLCVPQDCGAGCPAGQVCSKGVCVPACDGVSCPGDQVCQDGQCIDPCANIECPMGLTCQMGKCVAPCACYAADIGCAAVAGTVCDPGQGICVPPACVGVVCDAGKVCDPATGGCVDFCNDAVTCPKGQHCVAPKGCVGLCDGVTCTAPETCNPDNGKCEDHSCDNVICFEPEVCKQGVCVNEGTGGAGGVTSTGGAGGTTSSGGTGTGASSGGEDPVDSGSCGCRTPGQSPSPGAIGALAALGLLAALRRRRRAE